MTDKASATISVRLNAADYAAFNIYHGRWQLAVLHLFYCALFALLFANFGIMGQKLSLAAALALSVALSGMLLAFQLWRIRARTAKLFERDNLNGLEQRIRLDESGLHHSTGDTTSHVPWKDVVRAAETRNALILYIDRNKAILLPKRDIPDLAYVLKLLQQHMPAAKLRLKSNQ